MDYTSDEYKAICSDHRAICEVAGFQPHADDEEKGTIFYLSGKFSKTEGEDRLLAFSIEKAVVSEDTAFYAKDEVLTALKNIMESVFPEHVIDTNGIEEERRNEIVDLTEKRLANRVAMQTRRGVANTKFLDFLFYKGTSPADAPFIVYKFGDKYGIFKHPNAEQYGFRLFYK